MIFLHVLSYTIIREGGGGSEKGRKGEGGPPLVGGGKGGGDRGGAGGGNLLPGTLHYEQRARDQPVKFLINHAERLGPIRTQTETFCWSF